MLKEGTTFDKANIAWEDLLPSSCLSKFGVFPSCHHNEGKIKVDLLRSYRVVQSHSVSLIGDIYFFLTTGTPGRSNGKLCSTFALTLNTTLRARNWVIHEGSDNFSLTML